MTKRSTRRWKRDITTSRQSYSTATVDVWSVRFVNHGIRDLAHDTRAAIFVAYVRLWSQQRKLISAPTNHLLLPAMSRLRPGQSCFDSAISAWSVNSTTLVRVRHK